MKLLVSACLLGVPCRYDAAARPCPAALKALEDGHQLIPVCPEILGGLATPRCPAERQGEAVITREGQDVTAQYARGAQETLRLARLFDVRHALLKENSPSCGFGRIYDGTFSGRLTEGSGVTAQLLSENGVEVFGESQAEARLSAPKP